MITKQTAYDLWVAYDEIEKGKKLLADLQEQLKRGETADLRDAFGRRRTLSLGVPCGDSAQRLIDVPPALAMAVIESHVAAKQAELKVINQRALAEAKTWINDEA